METTMTSALLPKDSFEEDNPNSNDWNIIVTLSVTVVAVLTTILNHHAICGLSIMFFSVFFPMAYSVTRLLLSDCTNKRQIVENRFDMGTIVRFKDSDRNCSLEEFMKEMNMRANFWSCLVAATIAALSFR